MKEYLGLVLFAFVSVALSLIYAVVIVAVSVFISGSSDCLMFWAITLVLFILTIPGVVLVLEHFIK